MKMNDDGIEESSDGFIRHEKGNQGEQQGAAVSGKVTDFSGAEGKPGIIEMFTRPVIGQGGNTHGGCVTGHVPAVGQKGHGTEQKTGNYFHDHCRRGQTDDKPGSPLVDTVVLRKKIMLMRAYKMVVIGQRPSCNKVTSFSRSEGEFNAFGKKSRENKSPLQRYSPSWPSIINNPILALFKGFVALSDLLYSSSSRLSIPAFVKVKGDVGSKTT